MNCQLIGPSLSPSTVSPCDRNRSKLSAPSDRTFLLVE